MTDIVPGQLLLAAEPLVVNTGRATVELDVHNTGRWPIQISSHYHFFEVNRRLVFDRSQAFGMRLDVPAGAGLRILPGETHRVRLVPLAGRRESWGFNGLTNGRLDPAGRRRALLRARARGFLAE